MNPKDLKLVVQEKYGQIAEQSLIQEQTSCCGTSGCCGELEFSMIGDEYINVKGHNTDADLGLGCGIPTQFAEIKVGDSVLDLGSGAGNDCFVARATVGETGKVTGIDFTDAMLEKARKNNEKLGFSNVEFVKGDIEAMPLANNQFNVIISNCVLNLVPDKSKAFAEMLRVLKAGGHFCVSDVVIKGELPIKLQKDAEMYVGCVSGAIEINEYLNIIKNTGFKNLKIHKKKDIVIPVEILKNYMGATELDQFKKGDTGIYSITISAEKDIKKEMINSEKSTKSRLEEYTELAKNSLVRVQYSCGGNSTSIDEPENIPIVSSKTKNEIIDNEDKTQNS